MTHVKGALTLVYRSELAMERANERRFFGLWPETLEQGLLNGRVLLLQLLRLALLDRWVDCVAHLGHVDVRVVVSVQLDGHMVVVIVVLAIASKLGQLLSLGASARVTARKLIRPLSRDGFMLTLLDVVSQEVVHLGISSPAPAACFFTRHVVLEVHEKARPEVDGRSQVRLAALTSHCRRHVHVPRCRLLDISRLPASLALVFRRLLRVAHVAGSGLTRASDLSFVRVDVRVLAILLVLLQRCQASRSF